MEIVALLIWCSFVLPVTMVGLYAVYFLLTLPLRRSERARFFLDLLETGLREGRSLEQTILSVAASRDLSMGVRFHLLAAHIAGGASLTEALEKVPNFLPRRVQATLSAGLSHGPTDKLLQAARGSLGDSASTTRGGFIHVMGLAGFLLPVLPLLYWSAERIIFPSLTAMAESYGVPAFRVVPAAITVGSALAVAQLFLGVALYLIVLVYLGGTWVSAPNLAVARFSDAVALRMPWKKKRTQRDFTRMLALLLDAEVPEPVALRLAAQSTGNLVYEEGAEGAANGLAAGQTLLTAMHRMGLPSDGEWRIATALQSNRPLSESVAGWIEVLDSEAYAKEITAAHLATTLFIVLNGLLIGLFVVGVFQLISEITVQASLW